MSAFYRRPGISTKTGHLDRYLQGLLKTLRFPVRPPYYPYAHRVGQSRNGVGAG